MVGAMEIVSELLSTPPLHILVFEQPDDTANHTLDIQYKQMTAAVKNTTLVFLIDPQSLTADTEVHLPPMSVETKTTLHLE